MTGDEALSERERAYEAGGRMAWLAMLRKCLHHLGYEGQEAASLAARDAETLHALRMVCEEFGDNDWPDNLDRFDVLEKHLARHLRAAVRGGT